MEYYNILFILFLNFTLMFSNPSDILKTYLNEYVIFYLKTGEKQNGILKGFDEHLNILILQNDKLIFFRGECIACIGQ